MPTQNTNSLLQSSDADLLQTADVVGKIYDGSEYINVDNERDKISLKPKALTKVVGSDTVDVDESQNAQGNTEYTIHAKKLLQGSRYIEVDNENDTISLKPEGISKVENSDTTYVTTRTDEHGNVAYKVNVNSDIVAPTYTGENPVVVNNTTKKISVNKRPIELEGNLHGTVTPEKFKLGVTLGTYKYTDTDDNPATADVTDVEYTHYGDSPRILGVTADGTNYTLGYLLANLPAAGKIGCIDEDGNIVQFPTVTPIVMHRYDTVDTTVGYEEFDFAEMTDFTFLTTKLEIEATIASHTTVTPLLGHIEISEDGGSTWTITKQFQYIQRSQADTCNWLFDLTTLVTIQTTQTKHYVVRVFNGAWANNTQMRASITGFRFRDEVI